MSLVLKAAALNDEPMSSPLIGRFDERGGTLGRSDTATFTLPDPERMISRVQAQVLHRDDGYWIENVSAASPILHNGRPLSGGMRVMLRDGDELRIGGYTLLAAFEDTIRSATVLRGRTVITSVSEMHANPPTIAGHTLYDGPSLRRPPGVDLPSQKAAISRRLQAALESALARFEPAKLESTLSGQSVFDALRPGNKRARFWELYLEQYPALREQVCKDFERVASEAVRDLLAGQNG